jgi:hypothetical protein
VRRLAESSERVLDQVERLAEALYQLSSARPLRGVSPVHDVLSGIHFSHRVLPCSLVLHGDILVKHLAQGIFIVLHQIMPSKRPTILLRLDEDAKTALFKAAKADDRSAQYVLEKIVVDWLRANGFLDKPDAATRPRR